MKSNSPLLQRAFLALAPLLASAAPHAATITETFDKPPSVAEWNVTPNARVIDGKLQMLAEAPPERWGNSFLIARAGNPALNFAANTVELQLTGLSIGGTAAPENSVFMAIISADSDQETKAESYVKIRITSDGQLLFNCADLSGNRSRETSLYKARARFPIKTLTLQLTPSRFKIKGTDAGDGFACETTWGNRIDTATWANSAPWLILRCVRRTGEGSAQVSLDTLNVTTTPITR